MVLILINLVQSLDLFYFFNNSQFPQQQPWLQSGHHVVNFFQLVGFQDLWTAHLDIPQNITTAHEKKLKALNYV